jgi:hypothetical protein
MVKPHLVLAQFAFEPFKKLPKVIDELPVEVLEASLDLALVLRMRRTRKMSLNMTLTASFLPLLLELAAVIRKNSLKKPLQPLQNRRNLSRRQLAGQTVHHKLINHFQRADMLKASADGSIVITLTPGLTIIFYSHKASEAGSIC